MQTVEIREAQEILDDLIREIKPLINMGIDGKIGTLLYMATHKRRKYRTILRRFACNRAVFHRFQDNPRICELLTEASMLLESQKSTPVS